MSQRDGLAMADDEVTAFLEASWRAHVATINADGTPHVVPLSYVMLDGRLTVWTDPRSRKVANLRRDPRITCLVEDGAQFAELRAVQLSGRAVLGYDPETSLRVGLALFERASGELNDELRDTVAGLVATRVAVTVHPERIVSWDHRKLPGVQPSEIGA
jgi:PPOX class probable F420-dependent enzyme